jgi:hypothetical protein
MKGKYYLNLKMHNQSSQPASVSILLLNNYEVSFS